MVPVLLFNHNLLKVTWKDNFPTLASQISFACHRFWMPYQPYWKSFCNISGADACDGPPARPAGEEPVTSPANVNAGNENEVPSDPSADKEPANPLPAADAPNPNDGPPAASPNHGVPAHVPQRDPDDTDDILQGTDLFSMTHDSTIQQ